MDKIQGTEPDASGALGAMSIVEFCSAFRISRSAVYNEIKAGRLKPMKVGSRTLLPFDAVRAWQKACEREAADEEAA